MDNTKNIVERYEAMLDKFQGNPEDSRSVGWSDRALQWKRFEALTSVVPIEGKSILDLGCGLGNLVDYLSEKDWKGDYTGWDLSDKMVKICRDRFPDMAFDVMDILNYDGEKRFDVVVASGLFCVPLSDETRYHKTIEKMFSLCREAIAFNLISTYVNFQEDHLRYTSPDEIFDFCKKNLTRYVALRHDYMPFDYAVYAYKKVVDGIDYKP